MAKQFEGAASFLRNIALTLDAAPIPSVIVIFLIVYLITVFSSYRISLTIMENR